MRRFIIYIMVAVLAASCGKQEKQNVTAEKTDALPMLIRDIQKTSRLYTSEYNIRKIVTYSDEPRLKGKLLGHELDMKMPVGDRKIAIPINVTLKAYIDFAQFSAENVDIAEDFINVFLPEPQVTLTSSKVDQEGIREYVSLMRSRFSDEEMADFEKQGRQAVLNSLPRLDIRATARRSAAQLLIPMLIKAGYSEDKIMIIFKETDMRETNDIDLFRRHGMR